MRFLLLAVFLLSASPSIAYDGDYRFHTPRNYVEMIADGIINNASAQFDYYDRNNNYDLGLSAQLSDAVFDAEQDAEQACGMSNTDEDCGLDFDPILCSTENAGLYFYHTENQTAHSAHVYVSRFEDGRTPNIYTMKRLHGDWKITAIECSNGNIFNK